MCLAPEEPEQAPPSPIYIPLFRALFPYSYQLNDESPGYIPESDPEEDLEEDDEEDPEEDPADYPADRGDDDDDALALAEPAALCPTTPGLGYEVRESSAAGAARQIGPTTAEADLYDLLIFMAQQSEISELRAVDQRRQTVILELLKADYRRQRQFARPLKIVREPPGSDDRVYRDNRDLLMSCRARATIGRPVAVLRRSYWLSY
ncbi:hypothetical protein Tco_1212490 [Tanacetum coccineum]